MTDFELRCFINVANYRSFSKAANVMFISQSAASKEIRRLEEELGFPLFIRSTRYVTLTESGKSFYDDIIKSLSVLDHGIDRAKNIYERGNQILRIASSIPEALRPVSDKIRKYSDRHPDILISLVRVRQEDLISMLETNLADAAVDDSEGFRGNPDLYTAPVVKSRIIALVNRDSPLSRKRKLKGSDLISECLIHPVMDSKTGTLFLDKSVANYTSSILTRDHLYAESMESMVFYILCNRGIGLLPEYIPIDYPELKKIPIDMNFDISIDMCIRKDLESDAVRSFMKAICDDM